MSNYWGSSFGRWSPFQRQAFHAPPEVRDSDYHYIDERDIVDPPALYEPDYYAPGRRPRHEDEEEPDVLVLKHRGITYPLHFPAFSIGENLRVGTVRRAAADATQTPDPRRVRLLYKGRQLKDDRAYTREEGLKQNSELMAVVSEATNGSLSSSDEESPTEDEIRQSELDGGVSLTQDGRKRNRGKKGAKVRAARRDGRGDGHYEEPSRAPTQSNLQPSSTSSARRPSPSPSPRPNVFDPSLPSASSGKSKQLSGPLKQIADLEEKYQRELHSPVEKLLSNPPSDAKSRDFEVLRLTETIERDFLLKTDAIETDGNPDIRNKRKELVRMLQGSLTRLDQAKKRWAAST